MAASIETEQPVDWNQPCSEVHLAEISLSIVDWRAVSPFLGLSEAEEVAILESTHSVPARKMAMLRKWKQKKGLGATYNEMYKVFGMCELTDLQDKMNRLLAGALSLPSAVESFTPDPDPLTSYASYLRELYKSRPHYISQNWPHLPQCEFIQLAMIKDEEIRRGGPEEEMVRLAQQGKIETILRHKESIDLYNLIPSSEPLVVLPPPPPPPKSVCLIEGAPGGGKSTLALHICHQWAQGVSWLARFDLVVLAFLRDEEIQNARTLADILPADIAQSQLNVVPKIQASYGEKVLFIFDGWDEFPHHLMNSCKSLVSTIICKPQNLRLNRSTVLITSRPVSSINLFPDRRVEILGFTQIQIHEYIAKALQNNSTQIHKLVQHLEEHAVIEGYCYIPLHSAILVHIFLTMKGTLPTTLHELFCDFVLCCIVREQKTHKPDTCLPELSSLDDLPYNLKTILSNLSVLAYNGVMQNRVVFYSIDLQVSHLPSDLPSLGLLQTVEGLTLYSTSHSYNFLHLSVQELLAAYHISKMTPSEQVKVFKELFESSRFQAVLHYYCGFTKLDNPGIQKFITSYQYGKSNIKELLPLLHCFFEAQQPSLCQLVDPRFIPRVKSEKLKSIDLIPVDFLAIGYFITSLLSTSTTNIPIVHLSIDNINDHRLKLLLSELSKYPVKGLPTNTLPEKLVLYLDKPFITGQGAWHHLKQSSAIKELVLSNGNIQRNEDGLLHIAKALQTNSSITKLCLRDMNLIFTKENSTALNEMLQVNKTLTHLDLSGNNNTFLRGYHIERPRNNTTLLYLKLYKSLD